MHTHAQPHKARPDGERTSSAALQNNASDSPILALRCLVVPASRCRVRSVSSHVDRRRRPSELPWEVRHRALASGERACSFERTSEHLACGIQGHTRGPASGQASRVATRGHSRVATSACRVAHARCRRHSNGLRHGDRRARHPAVGAGVRCGSGGGRAHHRLGGAATGRAGACRPRHVPLEARGNVCACCLQLRPEATRGSCIDESTQKP